MLQESESADQVGTNFTEKVNPAGLVMGAGGTVSAILLSIWWLLCCWTSCPCCKCCRICRKRHATRNAWKLVLLGAGGVIMIGIMVAASYAFGGYFMAVDGIDNMACTVAPMLDGSVSGQSDPPSLCMIPLLNMFMDVDQSLSPDAAVMTGIRSQVASTAVMRLFTVGLGDHGLAADVA